ncbi:MAG: signal peptidase II [Peptococcaceae bacterium]|jgi:signal peptidase II|nr:signal peptidase II [Peptococcaceae bacterium]MBQ2369800.1 signal peptidase II [Peptococcaceae bacterium]MBQ5658131.1 signal peptidase II [Peptococcaceae bacterium]MBQ5668174.1 signal peptidase II [Peptococcaceae bacterium]MBQ5862376.1 signal peptidase II [Peptococcaceae bacterium]
MYFLIPFLGLLIADQAVKHLVRTTMVQGQSIPIIENIFHITYIENPGAAFGILANQRMLFLILTAVIVGVMIYLYCSLSNKKSLTAISLGIVVSGAIGNFIDRFMQGTVTDFLDFRIWPIFNIADIAICVGLALICYFIIIKGEDI